jgi:hypothetical protein
MKAVGRQPAAHSLHGVAVFDFVVFFLEIDHCPGNCLTNGGLAVVV